MKKCPSTEKPQSTRQKAENIKSKKKLEMGRIGHNENNYLIFNLSFCILHFDI